MGLPRIAATAVLVAGLAAAPALADWGTPERASPPGTPGRGPEVAVNARGDAVAAWVQGRGRSRSIVAVTRRAGEGWDAPAAISKHGRPAADPAVAIAADGRVVVVWREVARTRTIRVGGTGRRQAVYVARAREREPVAGVWETPLTLSSDVQKVGAPDVGMDASGVAVAAWHWGTGTRAGLPGSVSEVQVAESAHGGPWSAPRVLSGSPLCGDVRLPHVAVGMRGHAVVWWQCDLSGGRSTAMASARAPGEELGSAAPLPFSGPGRLSADLAVAADGTTVAASVGARDRIGWWRGPARASGLSLAELPALDGPHEVDRGRGDPSVAVDGSGDALTAWVDGDGVTRAASIAAGLGVAAPTAVSPAGTRIASAQADLGEGGAAVVAMVRAPDGAVLAAGRAEDGVWSAAEPVTRTGGASASDSPRVAVDAAGEGAVYWTRHGRRESFVARSVGAPPVG